jgi:hypothetical protein
MARTIMRMKIRNDNFTVKLLFLFNWEIFVIHSYLYIAYGPTLKLCSADVSTILNFLFPPQKLTKLILITRAVRVN